MGLRKRSSKKQSKPEVCQDQRTRLENLVDLARSLFSKRFSASSVPSCLRGQPDPAAQSAKRSHLGLPSKQDLENRTPIAGHRLSASLDSDLASAKSGAFRRGSTGSKIETPYCLVRQRLPKNTVIYEESIVATSINQWHAPSEYSNPPKNAAKRSKSIRSQHGGPAIPLAADQQRDSACSVDTIQSSASSAGCYKTLPNSRRTSGYSSTGSEVNQPNFSANATSMMVGSVSQFEEMDGYKLWASPQDFLSKSCHEYANFRC